MSAIDEANIHTTKLHLIRQVSEGLIEEPFEVRFCIKYTQAWENAWYNAARKYLVKAEEKKQREAMIYV